MPSTRSPAAYTDVAAVLDQALLKDVTYQLPTKGKAVRWKQRAYALRIILQQLSLSTLVPGQAPHSKYDTIVIRVDPQDPTKLHIGIRKVEGVLTDEAGNSLSILPAKNVGVEDSLLKEAEELFKGLGK